MDIWTNLSLPQALVIIAGMVWLFDFTEFKITVKIDDSLPHTIMGMMRRKGQQ